MNNSENDSEFDTLQNEVRQLYQQQKLEQPSSELDADVLAMAAAQLALEQQDLASQTDTNKGNSVDKILDSTPDSISEHDTQTSSVHFWQRNRWSISSAASVMLVAGLYFLTPNLQQPTVFDEHIAVQDSVISESHQSAPAAASQFSESSDIADVSAPEVATKKYEVDDSSRFTPQKVAGVMLAEETSRQINEPQVMSASTNDVNPAVSRTAANTAKQESMASAIAQQDKASAMKAKASAADLEARSMASKRASQLELKQDVLTAKSSTDAMLDTAENAFKVLDKLINDDQLQDAEKYLSLMEKRFPELTNKSHPLHNKYQVFKQKLHGQ